MIRGCPVEIAVETVTGYDDFGAPIISEIFETVDDCLIGQPTSTEITDALNMYGKKLIYVIGIPKGDTHNWENVTVKFFGQTFKAFGFPTSGIQENIPLRWGANIKVEQYG